MRTPFQKNLLSNSEIVPSLATALTNATFEVSAFKKLNSNLNYKQLTTAAGKIRYGNEIQWETLNCYTLMEGGMYANTYLFDQRGNPDQVSK